MKDAEQRYASADEFARDLEEHARLAVGPAPAERLGPDEPMPSAVPAPRRTPPRPEPPPADQATIDLRDALETTVPQPAAGATAPARPAGRPRLPPRVRWRVAGSLVASIAVLVAVSAVFRDRAPGDPTPAPSPTPTAVPAVTPTPVARPRTSPPSTPSPRLSAPPRTTEPAVTPGPVESPPAEAPVASLPTPVPSPLETPSLLTGRWRGYITDERCKERGAVDDHWDCVQACMRQGFRPLLAVEDKLYRLVGVERIRGNRNRPVVVEGTLDPATNTITVAETAAGQR
jgi:hypothetical protein